jgi:ubiquinone/menaquinone biosynthesis C-methylase UbiE
MNPIQRAAMAWRRRITPAEERGVYSGGGWLGRQVRDEVAKMLSGKEGKLLDVGCGEGLFLTKVCKLAGRMRVFGLDPWGDALGSAFRRKSALGLSRVSLVRGTAFSLPFQDDTFDFVTCLNLTINLPDSDAVLTAVSEFVRVTRPGGAVYADFRNRLNPLVYAAYRLAPLHDPEIKVPLRSYSPSEIRKMLAESGLESVRLTGLGMRLGMLSPVIIAEAVKR